MPRVLGTLQLTLLLPQKAMDFVDQFRELLRVLFLRSQLAQFHPAFVVIVCHGKRAQPEVKLPAFP